MRQVASPTGYAGIGLDLGVGHLTAVAVDRGGRQILTWHRSYPPRGTAPGPAIAYAARLARTAAALVRAQGGTVAGLSVAVPGMVDRAGVVRSAPALAWNDVDLQGRLERALGDTGFPVGVDNGATLAALAEHRYGSHAGTPNLVYLADHAGTGVINAGVALRAGGNGAEPDHLPTIEVPVDLAAAACACEHVPCLATVSGLGTLLLGTRFDRRDGPAEPHLEVADLVRRAAAGDRRVLAALAEFGRWLGYTIGTLVNLFDPEIVLLGGYHATLAPWSLPAARRAARSMEATPDHGRVRLAVSALGHEAAALGGATTALTAATPRETTR